MSSNKQGHQETFPDAQPGVAARTPKAKPMGNTSMIGKLPEKPRAVTPGAPGDFPGQRLFKAFLLRVAPIR